MPPSPARWCGSRSRRTGRCRVRLTGAADEPDLERSRQMLARRGFAGLLSPARRPRRRARVVRHLDRDARTRAGRVVRVGQGPHGRPAGGDARRRSLPRLGVHGGSGGAEVRDGSRLSRGVRAAGGRRPDRTEGHAQVPVAEPGRWRPSRRGVLHRWGGPVRRRGGADLPAAGRAVRRLDRRTRFPLPPLGGHPAGVRGGARRPTLGRGPLRGESVARGPRRAPAAGGGARSPRGGRAPRGGGG